MVYVSIVIYKNGFFGLRPVAVENASFKDVAAAHGFAYDRCKERQKRSYGGGEFTFGFQSMLTI